MNGILSQQQTKDGIIGIGRYTPYGVAWIDVLQDDLRTRLFEIGMDPVSQEDPHVPETDIAGGVPFTGHLYDVLTRAFRNHDDGMPSFCQSFVEGTKEASVL